jgi:alkylation response protein AidB-like acyl-CoA dehydrogenase
MATSTRTPLDHDGLAALGREVAERGPEIESLRRLPDDVSAALVKTGMCRAFAPRELGAAEAEVGEVVRAIEGLAYGDGATGWCAMIAATTSLLGGYLPEEWAETVYGDPGAVTGGFAAPMGRARQVDGGLEVTGRWQWGSGSHHCTWLGGGALVVDDEGTPAPRADGLQVPFVLFSPDQVELLDTWHVSGLRGTGSTDYETQAALVPEGRWVQLGGPPLVDRPLYRFPFNGALAVGVSAVALGLGRRAIDELIGLATEKRPQGSSRTLAERAVVQTQVSEAQAAVTSARLLLEHAISGAAEALAKGALSDAERRALRLAATNAAQRSAEAVSLCYNAAGATAVYETSPLQRVFRDVSVATQHAMVAPRIYEVLGRATFGLETDHRQL